MAVYDKNGRMIKSSDDRIGKDIGMTSNGQEIKIGESHDGKYRIYKDTHRGAYYLTERNNVKDMISFNSPSVETRLERWASIYDIELNSEYLNSSRKMLKSSVEPDYDPFTGVYFSNLEDNLYFSYAPAELQDLSGWGYGSYDEGELGGECWDELPLDEIKESCKRFEDEVRRRVTDENDVNAVLNDFYEKAAIPSGVPKGITNSRKSVKSALSAEQTRELFDKAKQMAVESLADEMGESVSEAEYRFYEELDKYEREDRTFAEYQKLLAEAEGSGPVESSRKNQKVKNSYNYSRGERMIKSTVDAAGYEYDYERVNDLCQKAVDEMGDRDALFFTSSTFRDYDGFILKGHVLPQIAEEVGDDAESIWIALCTKFGMGDFSAQATGQEWQEDRDQLYVKWAGSSEGIQNSLTRNENSVNAVFGK